MTTTSHGARRILAAALALTLAPVFFTNARATHAQTKRTTRRTTRTTRRTSTTNPTTKAGSTAKSAQPVRVPQLAPASQSSTAGNTNVTTGGAVASAQSQQPPQSPSPKPQPSATPGQAAVIDDDEVLTVNSNLVVVPASVTDAGGAPVQGLKAEDFQLEEEGRAQKITAVGSAEQVPLDIAILFDVSSSVMGKIAFDFQQESASKFLKQVLKPTDRAAIITIADKPTLVQPLTSAETSAAKIQAIPAATTSVPTAFYDTVSFAAKYLVGNSPSGHRRVIVAVSDGDDNFSDAVREQSVAEYEAEKKAEAEGGNQPGAARAAAHKDLLARHQRAVLGEQRAVQNADAVFYSINPGGVSIRLNEGATRGQNNMQQLAEATGGTAYVPASASDLETVFRQIASELRAQYLLQYYSSSDAPAGKFLNIKVTLPKRPELKVRARRGYYAKKG